jgi:hypothetical protein
MRGKGHQKCQAEYACITAGRMPGVMNQGLRQSEAWLANRQPLVGMMAGLPLLACRHRPIIGVVARASH